MGPNLPLKWILLPDITWLVSKGTGHFYVRSAKPSKANRCQYQGSPHPMATHHHDPRQHALRLIGEVREPSFADQDLVERLPTFRAALRYAVGHSGLTQEEIAAALEINSGDFSRMVREPTHDGARLRAFPVEKLADFALVTGSKVAQQWVAHRVGDELIPQRETRMQRLQRELAELRSARA